MKTPFREGWGAFSPDGRWVAYYSNESGRNEVYVRPFIPPDALRLRSGQAAEAASGQWQGSTAGGIYPVRFGVRQPSRNPSLDGVAERSCVVSDPSVPRDDRHERWRFGQFLGSRQMHCVEGANGFHREGAADSRKNRVSDPDQVATTREDLEAAYRSAFVCLSQPPGGAPAEDGAAGFRNGQRGRHSLPLRAYRRPGCRIALQ